MELRHRREALVGVLIILGAAAFLFLSLWLRGRSLREVESLKVVFDDVAGLKEGDPVRTSGVAVGHVSRIALRSPGNVEVWFTIEEAPEPRADARAEIRSADLFGARYIEYSPGTSPDSLAGREIRGTRVSDLSELAAGLGGEGRGLLLTAAEVSRELRTTLVEARQLIRTLNAGSAGASQGLIASLEELRNLLHRTDLLVAEVGPPATEAARSLQRSSQNLDRLTTELVRTSALLDSVVTKVNSGRGLAAALLNDTALVGELRSTNTALRELLVDFRANPGRYIRLRL